MTIYTLSAFCISNHLLLALFNVARRICMIPLLIYFSFLHVPILVPFGHSLRGLPLLLMHVESELVATERGGSMCGG